MFRRLIGFVVFLFLAGALAGAVIATGFAALRGPNRWIVVGVTIVALVGFGALVRRMFGRTWAPVGNLIDATRRLGEGDVGVRIESRGRGPLAAVSASFNRMAARLEEEDERRRRLLADLGHELRTPLTVVRGEIESVLDGLHPPESLSNVIDEVSLMERLLEDLRVLALAEAGRLDLHKEATDIGGLVDDVVASFSATLHRQGVETETRVQPAMPELDVDPFRIHQVVANLVSNAVNHMRDGGSLKVAVYREDGWAVIEVSDSGAGVPDDQIDQIFERFVKTEASPGTGLGLSIARDLVEAHGGTIAASNRAEGGAVFTIRLPDGNQS
jgi:two-component system, OmpR family, sensor histidine kinase BaeS